MDLGTLHATLGADLNPLRSDLRKAGTLMDTYVGKTRKKLATIRTSVLSLKGAFIGLGAGIIVRQFVKTADALTLIESRLSLVTDGTEDLIRTQKDLLDLSNETRSAFQSTADLYARVARSTRQLDITQKDLLQTTKTINQAIIVSGASSTEANAAIIQLSQGLAAGALRGEELNSVMEQTPRLAQAMAAGMGIGIGKLRELGAAGKLTAEVVIKALLSQSDVINTEYGKMTLTVGQAFTVLGNEVDQAIKRVSDLTGANKSLAGSVTDLTGVIKILTSESVLKSLIADFGRLWDLLSAFPDAIFDSFDRAEKELAKIEGGIKDAQKQVADRSTFNEFVSFLTKWGNDIISLFTVVIRAVGRLFTAMVGDAIVAVRSIGKQFDNLVKTIIELLPSIKTIFSDINQALGALLRGDLDGFKEALSFDAFREVAGGAAWQKFVDDISADNDQLGANWRATTEGIASDWKTMADKMLGIKPPELPAVVDLPVVTPPPPVPAPTLSSYDKLIAKLELEASLIGKTTTMRKALTLINKVQLKEGIKLTQEQTDKIKALVKVIGAQQTSQAQLTAMKRIFADMGNLRVNDFELSKKLLDQERTQFESLIKDEDLLNQWYFNRLEQLQDDQTIRFGSMIDAMRVAQKRWVQDLQTNSEIAAQAMDKFLDTTRNGFADMFEDLLSGTTTDFEAFANDLMSIWRRALAQMAAQKLIAGDLTGLFGLAGSPLGRTVLGASIGEQAGGGGTGSQLGGAAGSAAGFALGESLGFLVTTAAIDTAIGGAVTAALGFALPGVGLIIGALLGGVLGGLLDRGPSTIRGGTGFAAAQDFDILANPRIEAISSFNFQDQNRQDLVDAVQQATDATINVRLSEISGLILQGIEMGLITPSDVPEGFLSGFAVAGPDLSRPPKIRPEDFEALTTSNIEKALNILNRTIESAGDGFIPALEASIAAAESEAEAVSVAAQQLAQATTILDLQGQIAGAGVGARPKTIAELKASFDELSATFDHLDTVSTTYFDDARDILTEQLAVQKQIQSLTMKQVAQNDKNIGSINQLLDSLEFGEFAPVQSRESFQNRFDQLMALTRSEDPDVVTMAIQSLTTFLPDFLRFQEAFGGDQLALIQSVRESLEGVKTDLLQSQAELLGVAFEDLASATEGLTGATNTYIESLSTSRDELRDLFDIEVDIPDVDWDTFIGDVDWGDFIRSPPWKQFLSDVDWDAFVTSPVWTDFIGDVGWDDFITSLAWPEFVADVDWKAFVLTPEWEDLVASPAWPSILASPLWAEIVDELNWGNFVSTPDWPGLLQVPDGFTGKVIGTNDIDFGQTVTVVPTTINIDLGGGIITATVNDLLETNDETRQIIIDIPRSGFID
jgi:tape measure domain-containing protein